MSSHFMVTVWLPKCLFMLLLFVCDSYLPLTRFPALRGTDYSATSLDLFERIVGQRVVRVTQYIAKLMVVRLMKSLKYRKVLERLM